MDARDVLRLIRESGLTLRADGDRLTVAPSDRLTDDLRTLIRSNKPEILAGLKSSGRALDVAQRATAEITKLVQLCGRRYGFTEVEHAEALAVALADPVNALMCFRSIRAGLVREGRIREGDE